MNKSKFSKTVILTAAIGGMILGSVLTLIINGRDSSSNEKVNTKNEPLYWVAPMDSNYRRDKPGKSPMGMELIPVYDEEIKGNNAGPGTINISPDVVNNLGVRIAIVERKALHRQIQTVGYVKYDEDHLIHIHPRVSGWVEKLYVKAAGDPVKKSDPLYALYSPELVNAQEEFLLALNRNNSRLIEAAADRLSALQIPSSFIKKLKRNKIIEQTVTFYAPQDGVVDNLNIREGFFVQPGTTMLSIGSLNQVWVEAQVFERQASDVKEGEKVSMTLDFLPGKTWDGSVDYVYPVLDSQTRTIRVRLRFDNPEYQLKPNMFAQVVIHSKSEAPVLLIPKEALIRTGLQNRAVLALGEGNFKSVEVKVGREDQQNVEILAGLDEGDEVVSSAQFLLDSESSKSSDFKRMHHSDEIPQSVWVGGVIDRQMIDKLMVTVSHDAIDDWKMSAMTMNFIVSEGVDIEPLTPGTELHMKIQMGTEGIYEITGVHIMGREMQEVEENTEEPMPSSNVVQGQLDHSQMNHKKIDHSKMDHSNHVRSGGE